MPFLSRPYPTHTILLMYLQTCWARFSWNGLAYRSYSFFMYTLMSPAISSPFSRMSSALSILFKLQRSFVIFYIVERSNMLLGDSKSRFVITLMLSICVRCSSSPQKYSNSVGIELLYMMKPPGYITTGWTMIWLVSVPRPHCTVANSQYVQGLCAHSPAKSIYIPSVEDCTAMRMRRLTWEVGPTIEAIYACESSNYDISVWQSTSCTS